MWNNLTPQQRQYLVAMLMGHQGGGVQPVGDVVPFGGGNPVGPIPPSRTGSITDFLNRDAQWSGQPGYWSGASPYPMIRPLQGVVPNMTNPANEISYRPGQPQLSNPLMTGGNSAVNPQQQAQMMQYMQMLQSPQGFGATANGNVPVWQMMMGRSPMYGTGGAVV